MFKFNNENYLTIQEISDKLNLHYQSIARLIKVKSIPYKKLGRNKYVLEADINKFFN